MTTLEAQRSWEAEFKRLNEAYKAQCASIDADDGSDKFRRKCRAQLDMLEAVCPTAPPRSLFGLFEALQDAWEEEGPLEALQIICLEMQLEIVHNEIERRDLRQEHKIFLRTVPRRKAPWVRDSDDF